MSNLSQFTGGWRVTRSIINAYSSGGASVGSLGGGFTKPVLSGALTAATLKSLLTLSGAGELGYLDVRSTDATARTIRCQVKVDGLIVFDATTGTISASQNGMLIVGELGGSPSFAPSPTGLPIRWNSSLEVLVASSLTETDKVAIDYTAQTF